MSGRIRTIKPELLEDEKTAALDHDEWRVFVSLLLVSDDHGNCRAAPEFLEGQTLWGRRPSRDFREILARLSELSLVTLYKVRGQAYLHISGWEKHQKVDKPGKPRVPGENEADPEDSRDPRETLAPDLDPDHDLDPEGDHECSGARVPRGPTLVPAESPSAPESEPEPPKPAKPKRSKVGARKVPPDWQPKPEHAQLALEHRKDIGLEAARFRDHEFKSARSDWDAAFRNWLRSDFGAVGSSRQAPAFDTFAHAENLRRQGL